MKEEIIKDYYNRIIGYIQTDGKGNKKAFNFYRQLLGTYEVDTNLTKDFYRRIVARGDVLVALIWEHEKK